MIADLNLGLVSLDLLALLNLLVHLNFLGPLSTPLGPLSNHLVHLSNHLGQHFNLLELLNPL